eukprot:CAMPEP_0184499606 /NCGR_PEP_ID=MMETSP0113_2-20130426/41930_1 /TAXON_ID=91329 /ORGANISM="Norrisiella sphaerica, Strain BC52" /LENGTH=655 /DNA_ID=CAMNT_0026887569 /DNA_START=125 /DNA_END=2092 /DNA_ORIENTATION=+
MEVPEYDKPLRPCARHPSVRRVGRKRIALSIVVALMLGYSVIRSGFEGKGDAPRLGAIGDVVRGPVQIISGIPQIQAFGDGLRSQKENLGNIAQQVKNMGPKPKFRDRSRTVRSVEHMNRLLGQLPLQKLSVKGEGKTERNLRSHPVLKVMRQRLEKGYRPGQLRDGNKVALAIEGGGMRGAVGAGMAHAVSVLGLNDAIDCVYGSSAGSIVGAYFVSRQCRATGIYRDLLPCAKDRFLNIRHLLPALVPSRGLASREMIENPLNSWNIWDGGGLGEVFNLTFLLEDIMGKDGHYPLDWETFTRNNKHQPLHICASAPLTRRSVRLTQQDGNFNSLKELFTCMRASMCVPGLAGPPQYMKPHQSGNSLHILGDQWGQMSGECEPLVDALLYEPIPYRQAVKDGATHVLTLRTRAEDAEVLGEVNAGGIWEHHICHNYFRRYGLENAAQFMRQLGDKRIYAEDVLTFNSAAGGQTVQVPPPYGDRKGQQKETYIMNMVPPKGCALDEMEMDREKILNGLRAGFAAAFDALATDEQLATMGSGAKVAKEFFPETSLINEYDFTTQARERLLEAGVKIYQETDRNSRLLKGLDMAQSLAAMPIRAPRSLFNKLREKRRARKLRKMRRERQRAAAVAPAGGPAFIPLAAARAPHPNGGK